jgi:hypothetical protein
MNFKDFFAEAETIDGRRMGSEAAALRILEPYRSSNWHFLVLADSPQEQLPRDGVVEGMSIGEFMREGFANVRDDDSVHPRYVIVVEFVLKDETNMNIRCLDGSSGDNPWMWQQDAAFISKGQADPKSVMPKPPPPSTMSLSDKDWEKQRPEADSLWRAKLASNVYDKLPNDMAKAGGSKYDPGYYKRYAKIVKDAQIDVILDKCPLSKASSIRVFPRVVTRKQHMLDGGATTRSQTIREVARFQIPSTFNGFEQLQGGFQRAHSGSSKEAGAVEEKLNNLLQDQIADRVQNIANEVQSVASFIEEEGGPGHDEASNQIADGIHDLNRSDFMDNLAAALWKVSRLVGMMRTRSGQDFSGIWNDFLRYDEPFYEQIFSGLKKIIDFANRNLPGYKKEAERLSKVRQKLIRSLFAVADVTGQPTETLRHRVGLWND